MRGKELMLLVAVVGALPVPHTAARAQPAGCRPGDPAPPGIPLQLDLSSLPGAASRKATGSALVMVPSAPPANCAANRPHLPRDVLHGDPGDALTGDALTGEGPPDLLRGAPMPGAPMPGAPMPGAARVEYGPSGPQRPVP